MRSTLEIIAAVKDKQPVTMDELKTALLVMELIEAVSLRHTANLKDVATTGLAARNVHAVKASRWISDRMPLLSADASETLEPINTPGNPEFDRRHAEAKQQIEDLNTARELTPIEDPNAKPRHALTGG